MNQTTVWQVFPKDFAFKEADINWLNACGLDIEITNSTKMSVHDSGWCDASTGLQIVTGNHKIYVTTTKPEEETWVKLYWEDRAIAIEWTQYEINNLDNDFKGENENVID